MQKGRHQLKARNAVAPAYSVRALSDSIASDARVARALELMRQGGPKPAGEIASVLNLSYSHFRHIFNKDTGMTVQQTRRSCAWSEPENF